MDRGVFVQLSIGRELSHLDHLTNLLVADELFVDFLELLLEDKVLRVFEDLFAVQAQDGFPDFLEQGEVDAFAAVLVEALEVTVVDVDSLGVYGAVTEVVLDLAGDILSVNDLAGLFLAVLYV